MVERTLSSDFTVPDSGSIASGKVVAKMQEPVPSETGGGGLMVPREVTYTIEDDVFTGANLKIWGPAEYIFKVYDGSTLLLSFTGYVDDDTADPVTFDEIYRSRNDQLQLDPPAIRQGDELTELKATGVTNGYRPEAQDGDVVWTEDAGGGGGGGDMNAATYDPTGVAADAFDRANHHGTDAIDDIDGLQTALDAKLPLAGGVMTGHITLVSDPVNALHPASKQYVETAIANLINSAPGALDTLDELAASLGDDADFVGTVTTALAGRLTTANNLSELTASAATARGNLGIGDVATHNDSEFVHITGTETITGEKVFQADGFHIKDAGGTVKFRLSGGRMRLYTDLEQPTLMWWLGLLTIIADHVGLQYLGGLLGWNYNTGDLRLQAATGGTNGAIRLEPDSGAGVGVGVDASLEGLDVGIGDRIRIRGTWTPGSSSDPCQAGEIGWDDSYIYVATATNTIKRVAIATW